MEVFNARGCQDFSYSLKIRLIHFYINTLPLGVSFPIAIELMLITPISFELCPILCSDLGVFNNFGVFIKESSIEISVSSIGEFCIITYTVLYYLKCIFFDPI